MVWPGPARADDVHFGASDVRELFFVSKSTNANRVRYGLRLDSACRPRGDEPLYAYWQNLEKGPKDLEPLGSLDHLAYGIEDQRVVETKDGPEVQVVLRAVTGRSLRIRAFKVGEVCGAEVLLSISGKPARLDHVHVTLNNPFSVHHLDLLGRGADGALLEERLTP